MTSPVWEILQRETLLSSPWLTVEAQTCRLPSGKTISPFYMVHQPDWVLILAQDVEGFWIMGRQYRHGVGRHLLEFPAGIIDGKEDPIAAAQRELREESGYAGGSWEYLRAYPVNPDRQGARFHIVRALGVTRSCATEFDECEEITLERKGSTQIEELIANGGLEHPHHILAWLLNLR